MTRPRLCPCGGCRRLAELEAIESAPWPEPCSCHRPDRVCHTHAGTDPLDLGADEDGRVAHLARQFDAPADVLDAAPEFAAHLEHMLQTVVQRDGTPDPAGFF